MFGESAELYDAIYEWKDYAAEAATLKDLIRARKRSKGRRLLDVACGTGKHLELLRDEFEVEGLDVLDPMARMARERNPGVPVHVGDMRDFDLGRTFDVVVCLFSSIGYLASVEELAATMRRIRAHLVPGGLAVIEPWFTRDAIQTGTVHMLTVDRPELKVCRMNTSGVDGNVSLIDFHYLVGTPEGTRHFTESHRLTMFEVADFARCFAAAGLEHEYLADPLNPGAAKSRGLHVGVAA